MAEDRPPWARRMTNDREARNWSQADAVRAMRAHAPGKLPNDPSLLRQWKRWEAGEVTPSDFYQPIIAATFGTVTHAMFRSRPGTMLTQTCWRWPGWTPWNWSAACNAQT